MKNKIVPHLWFDTQAKEASEYYCSLFPKSAKTNITTIHDTPSGDADIVSFRLWDQEFMAISAGPVFTINPSSSFYVYCGSEEMIDRLYCGLLEGGQALMSLQQYPWSQKYAWIQDKFGLSWQLDIADNDSSQKIVPAFLFANEKMTKVKEAARHFTGIFPNSKILLEAPYDPSAEMPEGTLLFAQVSLNDYRINMMSSNLKHEFDFNEAVSLIVNCEGQEEIDFYWEKLTEQGEEQPCGWLKDKFGISWQIVPVQMQQMMQSGSKEQLQRVTEAFLKMKKFDLQTLISAYQGK